MIHFFPGQSSGFGRICLSPPTAVHPPHPSRNSCLQHCQGGGFVLSSSQLTAAPRRAVISSSTASFWGLELLTAPRKIQPYLEMCLPQDFSKFTSLEVTARQNLNTQLSHLQHFSSAPGEFGEVSAISANHFTPRRAQHSHPGEEGAAAAASGIISDLYHWWDGLQ